MSNIYNIVKDLCDREGIKIAEMCRRSGVSQSAMTELKQGRSRSLSHMNMQKIANYFDVSIDVFGDRKDKTPVLTEKDKRDIARDVERIMDDLEHSGDLMFDGDPMSDEAKESMRAAMMLGLEAAKLRNKETYTPKKYRG